jgi:predicted membrane protein
LEEGASVLLDGVFREPRSGNVTRSNVVVGGTATIVLDDNNFGALIWNVGENDMTWNVALSPDLPLRLSLNQGAGQITAELTGLDLESVSAKQGAGEIILELPATGDYQVDVSLGVGSVDIRVPDGLAISVDCTTAVGNCALPNGSGLWSQDYTSEGFETAAAKARIHVTLAVGEAKIR